MNNVFIDFLVANMGFTIATSLVIVGIVVVSVALISCRSKEKKNTKGKRK